MKRYFITHVLPHGLCEKYNISIAASNFSWALMNSKVFDMSFSILPTNVISRLDNVKMKGLVYSSLRNKKSILSKLAIFSENWKIYRQIEKHSSVWLYNVSILNILLYFLLRIFKTSVKVNVIVLDIYIPASKFSFDNLLLWMINHANGTIRLANSPLFSCKNSICVPGVVPFESPDFPEIRNVKREFLLSGLLREDISQISLVLNVFSKLPDLTLHITGFAEDEEDLRQKCTAYENIHFHGKLAIDEYLKLLHEIPFLLSMRDPLEPGNMANFPSKVIEAILHNRIIISTIHYEQLNGLKYFEVSSDRETLMADIENISNMSDEELMTYANQANYVKKLFNPLVWDKNMTIIESKA